MKFILMLLSVYRITYMIVNETGPLSIFEKFRSFIDGELYDNANIEEEMFWQNIDEGINCPYCVSVWISGIIWIISKVKFIGNLFIGIFGLAGAWMILNDVMEKLETNDS